jgi:hypothetical protein
MGAGVCGKLEIAEVDGEADTLTAVERLRRIPKDGSLHAA